MLRQILPAACAVLLSTSAALADEPGEWALVIHGGAGVIERGAMTPETEAAYRSAMQAALDRGEAVLDEGGSSLDAVVAVIHGLEDDPLFNSGRGAVFTAAGRNELDASIMDGETLNAGAVAGVTQVRHPISLAREVMENSRHVMLQGEGAETFAREQGLEIVEPAWFFTERRWASMERALISQGLPVPPRPEGAPEPEPVDHGALERDAREHRFGTVGVVALDRDGNIAAGTSTGGASFISFERAVNQGGLEASEFRLLIKSEPIPNPPIAMHPGLPQSVKASLKASLGDVHRTPGIRPESIRGYGGKQVDRYNTGASDALFEAMAGTIGFIDTDYQTAILLKSGS